MRWKLVPVDPTEAMRWSGTAPYDGDNPTVSKIYAAMLSAADDPECVERVANAIWDCPQRDELSIARAAIKAMEG